MTIDPTTATIDECRDWLTRRAGWEKVTNSTRSWWYWHIPGVTTTINYYKHPIPETLDAAAEAMPSGWWWCVEFYKGVVRVGANTQDRKRVVPAFDCDNELLARFRLAVACCMVDDAARKERGE